MYLRSEKSGEFADGNTSYKKLNQGVMGRVFSENHGSITLQFLIASRVSQVSTPFAVLVNPEMEELLRGARFYFP